MVRKLALAVSLALGTLSVPVHALGLGELDSRSTLNQNFNGDIKLLSVAADELASVRIKLADQEAFSRAGVDRPFYLSLLKFEPILNKRGQAIVRVTSDFPIREPFLNFLIEVNWPNGRLLREYTVLLDPPTTTRRRPPVVKPATKVARPAASPTPTKTQAAPATPAAPVAPSVTADVAGPSEYGPVKANDTAWGIAKRLRPDGVSMEQMMMALLEANPQAFINNDINRLRRGRILRVPSVDEIRQLNRGDARAAYRAQQDAWLARRDAKLQSAAQAEAGTEVDTATGGAPAADAAAEPSADKLRIATARPEGEGEAGAGDDAMTTTSDDLTARLITARENAETSRQEAETLRSRVDDLQARLQDMQRLLSLKDEQLAQLQDNVVQSEAAEAEQPAASLPLPGEEAEVPADVQLANQVEADTAMPGTDTVDEAAATPETPAEPIAEEVADAAQAIDDAVASLVAGDTAPAEDYRIEDIPAQVDPDRIVESGGVVEAVEDAAGEMAPQAMSTDMEPAAIGDLGIAPQIDPDRIVLGLDEPAAVSEPVADEVVIEAEPAATAEPAEAAVGELVIEIDAGEQATGADTAAQTPAAVEAPAAVVDAEPAPAPVAPAEPAQRGGDSLLPAPVAAMVEQNIVPIAAGGVAVLGLFGWLFTRGRRKQEPNEELLAAAGAPAEADPTAQAVDDAVDEPILNAESLTDLPDSSFLDDFTPSDINALQDETGEVDPVSEADVYIAYGRYQQAEELLRQAMDRDPDRLALKHKLLEVHYATRDADAYTALAQEMVNAGQDSADEEAWSRAQDMGRELAPENTLFALKEDEPSWTGDAAVASAAAAAGAVVATATATAAADEDSLSLEDLEISELTAAYEEEASQLSEMDPPSEVSITLDLDDTSTLTSGEEVAPAATGAVGLDDVAPLEFELPEAETDAESEDDISDTLDLDSMMADAEKAVDQDNSELSLDSDFSAAELQAQLDELSDLSALDSNLDDTPAEAAAAAGDSLGLVAEDTSAAAGLDEPLSLDTAFDAAQASDGLDTAEVLELDSSPQGEDDVATKLDLARAYVEMGDDDGARSILEEVVTEGSDMQRGEAKQLLSDLG